MSFLETPRFPLSIAYGSSGGPEYHTTIVVTGGGSEARNIDWAYPRHAYDAVGGVQSQANLEELIEFFHAVAGRGHGFRVKDFADFKSCRTSQTPADDDQLLGTGDGQTAAFQLIKTYTQGSLSRVRKISKPVAATVLIALDGVGQGSGWSVDTTTGIVTFTSAPATDVEVTAGYEFDVPARFDIDRLSTSLTDYQMGTVNVPILEIKL